MQKNPKPTKQETGAGKDKPRQTMTGRGVKRNTQTLITKWGTGEEREEGGNQEKT